MIRIEAPSRIHFGLVNVPVPGEISEGRSFGGIGLMVDRPGLIVEARPSDDWQWTGSLAERAERFTKAMTFPHPLAIYAEGPPEHVGLGVGTSLGMAIAAIHRDTDCSAIELAQLAGRGLRSGIGVHGFVHGGFVVDPGKLESEAVSSCESLPFPWPIVLICSSKPSVTWSGESERAAFATPCSIDSAIVTRTRLHKLIHETIVPSLRVNDFPTFSMAITEYNRVAGEPFAAIQGGTYSSTESSEAIAKLQSLGVTGVGQSSWGPTVFAICQDDDQANHISQGFDHNAVITHSSPGHKRIATPRS